MGILPTRTATGVEQNYVIDGSTQAADLLNTAQSDGDQISDVLADVSATAESSNSLSTELDSRLRALEQNYASLAARVSALENKPPA